MRKLGLGDVVIFLLVVATTVVISIEVLTQQGDELLVRVSSDQGNYLYAPEDYGEYAIPGPLGDTIIRVAEEGVSVIDSPCPDKLCIHSAPLSRAGSWNACLPNNVFLLIESQLEGEGQDGPVLEEEGELDGFSF